MAVGALIAMVIADYSGKDDKRALKFLENGAYIIIPAVIFGLIGILAHEARPLQGIRTFSHVEVSRTSNEMALLSLFTVLAIIYTGLWVFDPEYGSLRKISEKWIKAPLRPARFGLGVVTATIGVVFVLAQSKAYMLFAQPALDQITTFVLPITTLLLGITTVAVTVKYI